jgi:hypothetical protein
MTAMTARAPRITGTRFHILGDHHADGVVPGGNVAEADSRRLATLVELVVRLEIARRLGSGMYCFIVVMLSEFVRRLSAKFIFCSDCLLAMTIPVASATAAATTPTPFSPIVLGRFAFGGFRRLSFQAFAKAACGFLAAGFAKRSFRALRCFAVSPASAATAATSAPLITLRPRLFSGRRSGFTGKLLIELVGRLVHDVQRLLRLERPRLGGGRVNIVPSGQLRLDFGGELCGRYSLFLLGQGDRR